MAKKTDEKTLKLIAEVRRRKEEIADAEKPNYITNMSFSFNEGGRPVNLHVEKSVVKLISIAGFLLSQEDNYHKAVLYMMLGVDSFRDFQWEGFAVADWIHDIQTRINKVQLTSKRKQLTTMEARLNKIVSPELRAKMELAQSEEELGTASTTSP